MHNKKNLDILYRKDRHQSGYLSLGLIPGVVCLRYLFLFSVGLSLVYRHFLNSKRFLLNFTKGRRNNQDN